MSCKLLMRKFYKGAKFIERMDEGPNRQAPVDRRSYFDAIPRWFRERNKSNGEPFSIWSVEKSECSEAQTRVFK
jgi:hypothetical protein